jgi:hypothetical protein
MVRRKFWSQATWVPAFALTVVGRPVGLSKALKVSGLQFSLVTGYVILIPF